MQCNASRGIDISLRPIWKAITVRKSSPKAFHTTYLQQDKKSLHSLFWTQKDLNWVCPLEHLMGLSPLFCAEESSLIMSVTHTWPQDNWQIGRLCHTDKRVQRRDGPLCRLQKSTICVKPLMHPSNDQHHATLCICATYMPHSAQFIKITSKSDTFSERLWNPQMATQHCNAETESYLSMQYINSHLVMPWTLCKLW